MTSTIYSSDYETDYEFDSIDDKESLAYEEFMYASYDDEDEGLDEREEVGEEE